MNFKTIASALQIELPESYIKFHLSEKKLIEQLRSKEFDDSYFIATNENWLIATNRMLELPKERGMMNGKFCIGQDGCGSYYLINIEKEDTTVYSTEHDGYAWEEIFDEEKDDLNWDHKGLIMAKNLKEFVIDVIDF